MIRHCSYVQPSFSVLFSWVRGVIGWEDCQKNRNSPWLLYFFRLSFLAERATSLFSIFFHLRFCALFPLIVKLMFSSSLLCKVELGWVKGASFLQFTTGPLEGRTEEKFSYSALLRVSSCILLFIFLYLKSTRWRWWKPHPAVLQHSLAP